MDLFTNKKIVNNINQNIKIPWVEKYRPKNSDEILLETFIKEKIDNMTNNKSIPNMIITGEPGTGKTSTILFLAQEIYKNLYNEYVLELNASDDRGLSIINNTIYPFCKKKLDKLHKLIILDEADSITPKAQNLLSNLLTEFRTTTRFVFICNDCTKIIESIQSKCIIIKYPRINNNNLFNKIKYICENEKINYDISGINTLLDISNHDIRQAINNLECIYYSFNKLDSDNIYKLIDKPKQHYIKQILLNCINKEFNETIKITYNLYNNGYTSNDILLTFMNFINSDDNNILSKNDNIKIYDILSSSYIRVNNGIDTLLQLLGCISKIYMYFN
jgi:replication factor C subunit 2/4